MQIQHHGKDIFFPRVQYRLFFIYPLIDLKKYVPIFIVKKGYGFLNLTLIVQVHVKFVIIEGKKDYQRENHLSGGELEGWAYKNFYHTQTTP